MLPEQLNEKKRKRSEAEVSTIGHALSVSAASCYLWIREKKGKKSSSFDESLELIFEAELPKIMTSTKYSVSKRASHITGYKIDMSRGNTQEFM